MDARVKAPKNKKPKSERNVEGFYKNFRWLLRVLVVVFGASISTSAIADAHKPPNSRCLLINPRARNFAPANSTSDKIPVTWANVSQSLDLRPFGATNKKQNGAFQQIELSKLINRSQHSVIIRYSSGQQEVPTTRQANNKSSQLAQDLAQNKSQLVFQQEPFDSICNGWRTILNGHYTATNNQLSNAFLQANSQVANSMQDFQANNLQWPLALWAYDRRRQALIAKFLFYERADLLEFSYRLATLRSPILPPISQLSQLSECKIRFASLMTISSHLEITLVEVAPSAESSATSKMQQDKQDSGSRRHFLRTIMESKASRSAQLASKMGEVAAWQEQVIYLGREPGVPSSVFRRPYVIDIIAMPGMITSGSTERAPGVGAGNIYERPFLRGIGLKNISLSDECFDLDRDDSASEQIHSHDYLNEAISSESLSLLDSSNRNKLTLDSSKKSMPKRVFGIIWEHKIVVICSIGALIFLFILYAKLTNQTAISNNMNQYQMENQSADNQIGAGTNSLCALACCATSSRFKHHRIYPHSSKRRGSMGGVLRANKGGGAARAGKLKEATCPRDNNLIGGSQESLSSRGLIALSQMFDDVELNDNPQYRSILLNQVKRLGGPLDVYSIDRKRITLTRLLGKGAFGQVYQGYLICFNSGDQLSDVGDRNDSLESLGPNHESDDFYTRLDRQERRQRRLEYANCSQSREQLDSHSIPVAVKILTENGLKKIDFLLEASSMSVLSHRNIVGFIGVSFEEEPRYLVMEYLAGGNLKQFLMKNRQFEQADKTSDIQDNDRKQATCTVVYDNTHADDTAGGAAQREKTQPSRASDSSLIISFNDQTRAQHAHWSPAKSSDSTENNFANLQQSLQSLSLNIGDLLVIALDIARACDYLQKRKIIHRDLAARNCLLSSSAKRYPSRSQLLLTPTRSGNLQSEPLDHSHLQAPQTSNSLASTARLSASSAERHFSGSRFLSSFGQQQAQNHNNNNTFSFARPFYGGCGGAGSGGSRINSAAAAPSAAEVDANHRIDLEQVYLNGFCDSGIVAKLADFGMTREIEEHSDYYRSSSREIPIRWMPPEALNGKTTTKSDVWSFGVLMWEIFSLGQQPYHDIPDNNQVYRMIRARAIAQQQHQQTAQLNQSNSQATCADQQSQAEHKAIQQIPRETCTGEEQLLLGNTTASSDLDESLQSAVTIDPNNQNSALAKIPNTLPPSPKSPLLSPSTLFGPPLGPPYTELPTPIYSIMCACWANKPEERPQFEEIANRLYWCLQMPEVLRAQLPLFPANLNARSKQQQQQKTQQDQWWAQ